MLFLFSTISPSAITDITVYMTGHLLKVGSPKGFYRPKIKAFDNHLKKYLENDYKENLSAEYYR